MAVSRNCPPWRSPPSSSAHETCSCAARLRAAHAGLQGERSWELESEDGEWRMENRAWCLFHLLFSILYPRPSTPVATSGIPSRGSLPSNFFQNPEEAWYLCDAAARNCESNLSRAQAAKNPSAVRTSPNHQP